MQEIGLKMLLKQAVPNPLRRQNRRIKRFLREFRDRRRSRAEVFGEIYNNNLWGGEAGEFCSGEGSAEDRNTPYFAYVKSFIQEKSVRRVLDLGCGDFQVGRCIANSADQYIGVDVVPALIEHHRRQFANEHINFHCLDIVEDELPDADLVLIREVLQHLSNSEISIILKKLHAYPYVLVTEYLPAPERTVRANVDKAHGMDTRIWSGSGVFVDQPPFTVTNARQVLEMPVPNVLVNPGERLVTTLIHNIGAFTTAC